VKKKEAKLERRKEKWKEEKEKNGGRRKEGKRRERRQKEKGGKEERQITIHKEREKTIEGAIRVADAENVSRLQSALPHL